MRTTYIALLPCLAATFTSCAAQRPRDAELLRQFAKNGCNHRLRIIPIGPNRLTNEDACTLVTTALAYVGRGGAREIGVQARDTANLDLATISANDIEDLDTHAVQHEWVVEFALPGGKHSLAVTLDRVTGKPDAKLSEPIDLRP